MIPKLDALTNRPLSLALAGLLLVAAAGLAAAWNWFGAPSIDKPENKISTGASAATRWVATGCTMALLLFLTIATARRAELFQSELNLWQDAAFKSITNAMPHMQYALLLKREGRDSEAWQSISVARSIDPFSSDIAAMSRTLKLKEVSQ
jgi:hypothetical protein